MAYAIATVLALILDQALKFWTTVHIVENTGKFPLIPGVIHLANVRNTGAAFSFLQGHRWLLTAVSLAFVLLVVFSLSQ